MQKLILHIALMLLFAVCCNAQIDDLQRDYFRAQNFVLHGETDSAMAIWESHVDVVEFAVCLADQLIATEDYSQALDVCRKLESTNPAEAQFRMARIYAGMGFAEESVEYLGKHLAGKDAKLYSQVIRCKEFENINRTQEWRDFWETPRYSKSDETFADAEYNISCGNYDYAIEILEVANTKSWKRNYLYAKAYYGLEKYAQALKCLEGINSKDMEVVALRFRIEKSSGNYALAYETGKTLLAIDRYNAENLLDFAEVCKNQKKYLEARRYTGRYLQCFPDSEKALFMDSRLALLSENKDDALVEISQIIEHNSSNPEYFVMRGEIYYGYEMWDLAAYDFSMALDITPDDARLNYLMGMCRYYQASYEKACFYWRRAATGKSREAAEMYYRYCEE
ncbi:MAG: hypothetical protein J6S84_06990 [Bacteroidales bacterium]|nr:hypothetical protein [Bacteroidales bacterium]